MTPRDVGFLDDGAARMALRRIKLRSALGDIQALIPALLNGFNQSSDARGNAAVSLVQRGIELGQRDLEGRVGNHAVDGIEGQEMGEEELLEGADLVLQFLNLLGVHIGQGRFSSNNFNNHDASPSQPAAHRLSEGDK